MARFAPVAPIQMLEDLKASDQLGTYHLLLAHHVLEFPDRFRALFADLRNCTIIMDNSIVELGASENEEKVLEACKAIQDGSSHHNYVYPVLTDVMGDGAATRESARKSFEWWEATAPEYHYMVVLQGNDWKDFCLTADTFLLDPVYKDKVTFAGIPRILTHLIGSRQLAVQYVDSIRPGVNTHLLGFSDNVVDDVIAANIPCVHGIDSAVPLRYSFGLESGVKHRYTPTSEIPPRPENWFRDGVVDSNVLNNLLAVRMWVA